MLPRQLVTNQQAKNDIAFDTGYPPGRSPLAIEEAGGGPVCNPALSCFKRHGMRRRWKSRSTVARNQFQLT
jgi:hypothetical protein